jgi:hypothetical protein
MEMLIPQKGGKRVEEKNRNKKQGQQMQNSNKYGRILIK